MAEYLITLYIMLDDPTESEEDVVVEDRPVVPKPENENPDAESEEEAIEEEVEEAPEPTINLSDHTRTKDVLHRLAERVLENEDKLLELSEEDPKLLERLKAEFPKKFKDVKVPVRQLSEEDFDAKVQAAVTKQLKSSGKSEVLDALRSDLKMTNLEFEDIRESISDKADHYLKLEITESHKEAVLLALKNIEPKKYKDLVQKETIKELSDRQKNAKDGAGKSSSPREFSKIVLDNYKKYGFDSPDQLVEYQDHGNMIPLSL